MVNSVMRAARYDPTRPWMNPADSEDAQRQADQLEAQQEDLRRQREASQREIDRLQKEVDDMEEEEGLLSGLIATLMAWF